MHTAATLGSHIWIDQPAAQNPVVALNSRFGVLSFECQGQLIQVGKVGEAMNISSNPITEEIRKGARSANARVLTAPYPSRSPQPAVLGVECPTCRGRKWVSCRNCFNGCQFCQGGRVTCKTCQGTGTVGHSIRTSSMITGWPTNQSRKVRPEFCSLPSSFD